MFQFLSSLLLSQWIEVLRLVNDTLNMFQSQHYQKKSILHFKVSKVVGLSSSWLVTVTGALCDFLTLRNWPDVLSNCVSLRINSCPNNCSGHGRCSTANSVSGRVYCECEEYWKGEACSIPYCRGNCGSPDHGYCDLTGEKLCVCNDSWQGERPASEGRGRGKILNSWALHNTAALILSINYVPLPILWFLWNNRCNILGNLPNWLITGIIFLFNEASVQLFNCPLHGTKGTFWW